MGARAISIAADILTKATALRADGVSWRRIATAVGISVEMLRWRLDPQRREEHKVRTRERARKRLDVQNPREPRPEPADLAAAIAARDARARVLRHTDLTGFLMGDPEPGRRAMVAAGEDRKPFGYVGTAGMLIEEITGGGVCRSARAHIRAIG